MDQLSRQKYRRLRVNLLRVFVILVIFVIFLSYDFYPNLHHRFMLYHHSRDFSILLRPHSCNNQQPIFLLIAIKSLSQHADRRAAIRTTWGRQQNTDNFQVQRVFLLGRAPDVVQGQSVDAIIQEENRDHGDILQWDFEESFHNVTLKEYLFWKWFEQQCSPTVKYVLKGDDDVFVNIDNVIRFLTLQNSNSRNLYVGKALVNTYPNRVWWSKYYIPRFMFSSKPYPPYAGGGAYLLSRESIHLLHQASKQVDLFPIDDVYVGMCAEAANISVQNHNGFRTYEYTPFNPCLFRKAMAIHQVLPNALYLMWSLLKQPLKCLTSEYSIFDLKKLEVVVH
ncbi:N-acetyllactosaminide beta-1,3-N-acetylglucosaminyltransferase 3-like [Erpetoichthys calabaricus]|uniref:Hexosyltransferase n=1 Tax=Erpetoichthys calabaricus TaxID=27687 RepID=A0A8C4RNW2_ERPCA|nr:N-acetyllactosaminide beta-1,3-N-acetylglucosaminyltransferase 3-like [Erpetoichthys calabaricus]